MAKRAAKKTGATRNDQRSNGKAWGRHSRGQYDTVGHNATGRSKPSGHSVKGMRCSPDVVFAGDWSESV